MQLIDGGIFNFSDSSYVPPALDGLYSFTTDTDYKLNQIYTNKYIYLATDKKLSVYDITGKNLVAYIKYEGGFTTVAGNDSRVYVGTTNSGVKYVLTQNINPTTPVPQNLLSSLEDLSINITSENIKYINVLNDALLICTSSGVDYYNDNQNPIIHSKTYIAGAEKCFATTKAQYYTVSGSNEYSIYRIDSALCDWVSPSFVYTTGSGIFEAGIYLTDIYITEQTAYNGGNTIFCTTSSGVYIIDEDTIEYASYYIGQI